MTVNSPLKEINCLFIRPFRSKRSAARGRSPPYGTQSLLDGAVSERVIFLTAICIAFAARYQLYQSFLRAVR